MDLRPFSPSYGRNTVAAAGAASATATVVFGDSQVRICNNGTGIAYVRIFDSQAGVQVATTADCPVLPNTCVILSKAIGFDSVAYISAATTTLQIQSGSGGFV